MDIYTIAGIIIGLFLLYIIFNYESKNDKNDKNDKKYEISNLIKFVYYIKLITQEDKNINNLLSNIPIYVINLKRSKSRYDFMKSQEIKYKIHFNYINAIDGNELTNISNGKVKFFENDIKYTNNDSKVNKYEVACTLSHIKAIMTAYYNNDEFALICEDDVIFDLFAINNISLKEIINNAPLDWEYISLNSVNCKDIILHEYQNYVKDKCWGMTCYLINRKSMKNIIDKIYNADENIVLDKNISKRNTTSADGLIPVIMKSYYTKNLFTTYNNNSEMESQIHKDHTNWHIKYSLLNIEKSYNNFDFKNKQIPKLLHLIWIGNNPPPENIKSWTIDFASAYPDWTVKVWNDNDIEELNLVNKKYYDDIPELCGKADIARYEILYRYGGMYIDADSIWLGNPLNYNLFKGLLNMSYEKESLIMNTWFSCIKNHPFFHFVIDAIKYRDLTLSPWLCTGPTLITEEYYKIINDINISSNDINFVDFSDVLCPSTWHGITENNYDILLDNCKKSTSFAFHYGLSTNSKKIYFPIEKLHIKVDETISSTYYNYLKNHTTKESLFRKLVLDLVKSGDIKNNIIDCGAYIGDNCIAWGMIMTNSIIYAFEPSKKKCNFIENTCLLNNIKNVKVVNYGLSDKDEVIKVPDDSENFNYNVKTEGNIEENFTTLDKLYNDKIIENVDFFHLDVEGFEDKVLNGSVKILNELRPILTVEIHPHYIELGDAVKVLQILEYLKYNCYIIPECCGDVKTCRNIFCVPFEKRLFYKFDFQQVNYTNVNDIVEKN